MSIHHVARKRRIVFSLSTFAAFLIALALSLAPSKAAATNPDALFSSRITICDKEGSHGMYGIMPADFDGDGDWDVLCGFTGDGVVSWLENVNGDASVWTEHVIASGMGVTEVNLSVADVNGDGHTDVIGGICNANKVTWWKNADGKGTSWVENVVDSTFTGAKFVDSADIDRDGDIDLVADSIPGVIAWWENTNRIGTAWTKHTVATGFTNAQNLYARDIDGDGDWDVIGCTAGSLNITWWENTAGDGSAWTAHIIGSESARPNGARVVDIDRDGDLDVVEGAYGAGEICWYENTTGGGTTWIRHAVDSSFSGATVGSIADLDSDGDLDILGHAAWLADKVVWWENTDGNATTWTRHVVDDNFDYPGSGHAVDLDGDGDLDILGHGVVTKQIAWWENQSPRRHATFPTKQVVCDKAGSGLYRILPEDIDGDGDSDILGGFGTDGVVSWFENVNAGAWTEHVIANDIGVTQVRLSTDDINGDGDMDVIGGIYGTNRIAWWKNANGEGTSWTANVVDSSFSGANWVDSVDIDRDGDTDIVACSVPGVIAWWENANRSGTSWTSHTIATGFTNAQYVCVRDIDGDGDSDVLGCTAESHNITWWENTAGDGSAWTAHIVGAESARPNLALVADMDRDGDLDVVEGAYDASEICWYENMTGDGTTWVRHAVDTSLSGPVVGSVADLDNDGDVDILGASWNANKVVWWENTDGNATAWTRHVVDDNFDRPCDFVYAADLSRDGDLDILAGGHLTMQIAWWENDLLPLETVSTPDAPSGPTTGVVNVWYTFHTTGSVSSIGDPVAYRFDWGDGALSEWSAETSATHAWATAGTFTIKAKARSVPNPSVESAESEALLFTAYMGQTAERVVFEQDGDLWIMKPDGSEATALTQDAARDSCPRFNPTGSRIAFCSDRGGQYQIWTMDVDGKDLRAVGGFQNGNAIFLDWSSDGTRFVVGAQGDQFWIVEADGSGATELTRNAAFQALQCDWSIADRIAFTLSPFGAPSETSIHTIDANGSNTLQILSQSAQPVWNRTGARLFFAKQADLWDAAANGSGAINRTNSPSATEDTSAWSADGTKMYYHRVASGAPNTHTIYRAIADGSSPQMIYSVAKPIGLLDAAIVCLGTNQPPAKPTNVSPANGATSQSLLTILQASAFSDTDAGDTHGASHWQVRLTKEGYETAVVDEITNLELTSYEIEAGKLVPGQWYAWRVCYLDNHGNGGMWSEETTFKTIPVQPSSDRVIIVAGGGPYLGNPIEEQTKFLAGYAWRISQNRDIETSQILLLSAFDFIDADGDTINDVSLPTVDRTRFFAELNPATGFAANPNRLILYLVDHGSRSVGTGEWRFKLNQTETVTATEVDGALDALQAAWPTKKIVLIVDFCYGGGFVRICQKSGGQRRVCLSGATDESLAVFCGPNGEISFSNFLFDNLSVGANFREAFRCAREGVVGLYSGPPSMPLVVPWLEDNGDGQMSTKLDGEVAKDEYWGSTGAVGDTPPTIAAVTPDQTLPPGAASVELYADLVVEGTLERVWANIVPPNATYVNGEPVTDIRQVELTQVGPAPAPRQAGLTQSGTTERWSATASGFNQTGTYTVSFFAKGYSGDDPSGSMVSNPRTIHINGGQPAAAVNMWVLY